MEAPRRPRTPGPWPVLLAVLAMGLVPLPADEPANPAGPDHFSATMAVHLRDGSVLMGSTAEEHLTIRTRLQDVIPVPTERILKLNRPDGAEGHVVRLHLRNGDTIEGRLAGDQLPVTTALGRFKLPVKLLESVEVRSIRGAGLARGDGPIPFGGFRWHPLRVKWQVTENGRLMPLPEVREGFRYGHGGNGRGAAIAVGCGDPTWTDYRIEFDFGYLPPHPDFNPHHLPANLIKGVNVAFRVKQRTESWNQPGNEYYSLGIAPEGEWRIARCHNHHYPGNGWSRDAKGNVYTLAKGEGTAVDAKGRNHLKLEVRGPGIKVWINNQLVHHLVDQHSADGNRPLTSGGLTITFGWETRGWIENFSATAL